MASIELGGRYGAPTVMMADLPGRNKGRPADAASAAILVLGVLLGSLLWWFVLSTGVSTLRGRLSSGALRLVNVLAGLTILALGGVAIGSVAAAVW